MIANAGKTGLWRGRFAQRSSPRGRPHEVPASRLGPRAGGQRVVQRRSVLFDEFEGAGVGRDMEQMPQKNPVPGDLAVARVESYVLEIDAVSAGDEESLPLRLLRSHQHQVIETAHQDSQNLYGNPGSRNCGDKQAPF